MRNRSLKKIIKFGSIIIVIVTIGIHLYPFTKIIFTDEKVVKHNSVNKYYIIANNEEMAIEELKAYMKKEGFNFFEVSNNNYIFRKENLQREIDFKDIKTIII